MTLFLRFCVAFQPTALKFQAPQFERILALPHLQFHRRAIIGVAECHLMCLKLSLKIAGMGLVEALEPEPLLQIARALLRDCLFSLRSFIIRLARICGGAVACVHLSGLLARLRYVHASTLRYLAK